MWVEAGEGGGGEGGGRERGSRGKMSKRRLSIGVIAGCGEGREGWSGVAAWEVPGEEWVVECVEGQRGV